MPFFVNNHEDDDIMLDEDFDMDAYNEACLYMELASLPEEDRKAIAESEEAAILEAKGKISRKTIIRLNKKDDMERRTSAAAYQMAKDANDPLWDKLVKALILSQDYKIYQLVPLDTMKFLANATNSNVIKVYGYLLNKSKGFTNYKFTLMELATDALGLSKTTNDVEKKAEDCLNILTLAGLVKYENIYELNEDNRPVPRKVLKEVNTQYSVIEEKIKENVVENTFIF